MGGGRRCVGERKVDRRAWEIFKIKSLDTGKCQGAKPYWALVAESARARVIQPGFMNLKARSQESTVSPNSRCLEILRLYCIARRSL
jgi:hypothetical protein